MLNGSRLAAQGGNILRPVVDFFIATVAAFELPNRDVVVEELYMVEEDLRLYRFPCKRRRETVAVGVNRGKPALANGERRVAEYREIVGGQFKELAAFFPALLC